MLSTKGKNWTNFNTRQIQVEHQKRDTRLRFTFIAGAHKAEDLVALMCVSGPDFRSVDNVVFTVSHGPALQGREI